MDLVGLGVWVGVESAGEEAVGEGMVGVSKAPL
jgi:hypothetical protein